MEMMGESIAALQAEKHISAPTLEIVTDNTGFDALETDWNTLIEECGASIYQAFEWLRTWWKYFGANNHSFALRIIVVNRCDRIIGIAPFLIGRVHTLAVVGFRELVFIGYRPSDYLDVLFVRGEEAECADLNSEYLAGSSHLFLISRTALASRCGVKSYEVYDTCTFNLAGYGKVSLIVAPN